MYEDGFENLSELLNAFPSIVESNVKMASKSLEHLTKSTGTLLYELASLYKQNIAIDFEPLSELCNAMVSAIELPSVSLPDINFLKEVNFQKEYIELTEDDCDSINALLESSDTDNDVPLKVSNGKMEMADFIKSVLIPILAIVLPMLLTIYHHKVDSIESQKQYIEELQLKEEVLRINEQQLQNDIEEKEVLENILIELQNQSEYYKSLQAAPECPCTSPKLPDEVPEPFGEAPHSPDGIQDSDLPNPAASKSSETAMHIE